MNVLVFHILILMILSSDCSGETGSLRCETPQYLVYGLSQVIDCSFPEGFFGVYWYNSTDTVSGYPILYYQESVKGGAGYLAGEYDIHPNGSVVIANVSLDHDHFFSVEYLQTTKDKRVKYEIQVVVVVKPLRPYPILSQCKIGGEVCLTEQSPSSSIECFVSNVRPKVHLQWFKRDKKGDKSIYSHRKVNENAGLFSTYVTTTNVFHDSSHLTLLVCKEIGQSLSQLKNESLILVQDREAEFSSVQPITLFFEKNSPMQLKCTDEDIDFAVWKRAGREKIFKSIGFVIFVGERIMRTFNSSYGTQTSGSLLVFNAVLQHEGLYSCVFGGANANGINVYNVSLYVQPVPAYLVVDGCQNNHNCTLPVKKEGQLICSLKGIRPKVTLEWRTTFEKDSQLISFSNKKLATYQEGDTYDISVTSNYRINRDVKTSVRVECKVLEPHQNFLNFARTVTLNYEAEPISETVANNLAFLSLLALLVFIIAWCFLRRRKEKRKNKSGGNGDNEIKMEQETPMLAGGAPSQDRDLSGIKTSFIQELKTVYEKRYVKVRRVPFIDSVIDNVGDIFVESNIETISSNGRKETLENHQKLFDEGRPKWNRVILEGDPGYGKSLLAVQIASDWCKAESYLRRVEILILIRLMQMKNLKSIYDAIKKYLQPREAEISEQDIKEILQASDSVLVIMDGFDEYPLSNLSTDIEDIINNKMFLKFDVILTTRTSSIPQIYALQTTMSRMTGFDEKAQENYIRKVCNDTETAQNMKRSIIENPTLRIICEVPLLFTSLVHMTLENKNSELKTYETVTKFFHHIVLGMHSLVAIKKKGDSRFRSNSLNEYNHDNIDKLAFRGLTGGKQQIVWRKTNVVKEIGGGYYDSYVAAGILIEEDIKPLVEKKHSLKISPADRNTGVRFYHQLFCEWYAAHYLCKALSSRLQEKNSLKIFQKLDPIKHIYVYRFACGLDQGAAKIIIKYLQSVEECRNLLPLCILEKTGNVENIQSTIQQLCSEGFIISYCDSMQLQTSYLQVMELGSRNKIPVNYLGLHNCFQSVDVSKKRIILTSGQYISQHWHITTLDIFQVDRQMDNKIIEDIFEFSTGCTGLEFLWFTCCVPPRCLEITPSLSALKSHNITVQWRLFTNSPAFLLDLNSGKWKHANDQSQITDQEYQQLSVQHAQYSEFSRKEHQNKLVRKMRQQMRLYDDTQAGHIEDTSEL